MLQSGLMYTTMHKNPYWRFILESWVTVHASVIAMQTLPGWQMFFFGFLALLCLMQLPGLPPLRAIKPAPLGLLVRLTPTIAFIAGLAGWYASSDGSVRIMGIVGIPLAEIMIAYFVPFVLYLMLHPCLVRVCGAADADCALGRTIAWLVFIGSTGAALIGGVVDWHLPYAAWLADPLTTPPSYAFSDIGMAIALLGQLWAPARLFAMPQRESVSGGCCGANICCAHESDQAHDAAKAAGTKVEMTTIGDAEPHAAQTPAQGEAMRTV